MTVLNPFYDMIFELDKLEKLMPSYAEPLRFLSKVIRNKVWGVSDEKRLAKMLNVCNWLYSLLVEVAGEHIEIIEEYVNVLDRKSDKYTLTNLNKTYDNVRAHIAVCKTGDMVKEHWKQLNPYFRKEYARENLFKKDLIEILDDFFNNIVSICPNEFLVPLNNYNCLLRGRKKEWKLRDDLLPPSIECALQNNIINRWNLPSKRYLYLAIGNCGIENGEKVCLEEMRIRAGDIVTIANFDINKLASNKKIINLDFDNISRQDIFDFMNATEKAQTRDLIEEIYVQKIVPTKENIKEQVESHTKETTALACSFCGKLLLKEICDTIFV
ncbi:MAG: hypothetical protein PHU66_08895, partial [Bacteroidaceae bacterium]|nr:hypothetical protein [Bacteroidaceae bacterium]